MTGIFNVLDYGAVGNGSTDDTASIQDAIDAASTAGGGTVFFPAGYVFAIGSTINPMPNVQFLGYGATLLAIGSSNTVVSYPGDASSNLTNFSMLGLTIDLASTNMCAVQIPHYSCQNIVFRDCVFTGGDGSMGGQAVAVGKVYDGSFTENLSSQVLFDSCIFSALLCNTYEALELV